MKQKAGDNAGISGRENMGAVPLHLILMAVETYPIIPIVMRQDHGGSPAVCHGRLDQVLLAS